MPTGIYTLADLRAIKNQTIVEFGEDVILETIQRDVRIHNEIVMDVVNTYAEVTTDVQRRAGGVGEGRDYELDETGRARTQKVDGGYDVAFPLRTYGYSIGWTAKFLRRATPADIAEQTLTAQRAHMARIYKELRRAFFRPTNYSFRDYAATRTTLGVKVLANGDGTTGYPSDQNGVAVSGSHNHYLAYATLTNTAADALINTVLEHESGQVVIEINKQDESGWKLLTGFVAAQDSIIQLGANSTTTSLQLDTTATDNRIIGRYNGATVWTRTWVPQGYAVARLAESAERPLVMRQSTLQSEQGLYLAATNAAYPLQADQWEYAFGFGAYNRLGAAVLYIGSTTYTAPTLPE